MHLFDNQVRLTGRAGAVPSLRYLTDGTPCCHLRLYVNTAGAIAAAPGSSEAFRVTAFGELAQRMHATVRRGQRLYVEGSLHNHRFEHRGQTHIRAEVRVGYFLLVALPNGSVASEHLRQTNIREALPLATLVSPDGAGT